LPKERVHFSYNSAGRAEGWLTVLPTPTRQEEIVVRGDLFPRHDEPIKPQMLRTKMNEVVGYNSRGENKKKQVNKSSITEFKNQNRSLLGKSNFTVQS
jgi:hypothetical protein